MAGIAMASRFSSGYPSTTSHPDNLIGEEDYFLVDRFFIVLSLTKADP